MKTKTPTRTNQRRFIFPAAQVGAVLWLALALPAAATLLQLNFTVPSSFNESNRQAVLEWNAAPARTYLVQSTTNLSPETVWKSEAPVRASTNGPIKWMAPEALSIQKYYRLILPQPEVYSVEPSFVNSDDPAALFYLIGQCFPTNGSVVINGLNFTPTLVDSNGGWMAISLNGLPPGTPILGNILVLDNASNIVSTLPLQNPVFYGTELTAEQLQGPPDEPPASPVAYIVEELEFAVEKVERAKSAARGHVTVLKAADDSDDGDSAPAFLSKKGYDYYQAQSQLNSAGLQHNPYFQGNNTGGAMPLTKKGYDYYQAQSALRSDVQEGKKGLNAVKVKLAYRSGELLAEETDLAIPGRGPDFAWTRTYRSRTEATTAQGAGWDFSYNVSATLQPDGTVLLRPGNGRADTFYPNGTNGWTRDEYFLVIRDVDQDGSPDEVVFPDGGKWTLHTPGTAFAGKLSQLVDRNNNSIRCDYDTDTGRLLQVVDTLDRTNTVAYTAKGLIESVTDFSGRTVRYEYDSGADLIACISPAVIGTPNGNDFPGGKTNRYAYSSGNLDQRLNHNLVSITDPKGQICLEVIYQATNDPASLDFDAVSSVLRGIEKKDIRRGMVIARPGNAFATVQTIVNDYVGNVTEYLFDSRQCCVSRREFTGWANPTLPTTATENRPTGKLRAEDPDYFETRWEWNADSLCTLEIRPDGGSTEISHQRAQDHNSSRSNKTASRAHDGNVRVVRERASSAVDTDGDGAPDTTELAWYFEHDPRFGSPAAKSGEIKIKHKGWDGLIYHRSAGDPPPIIKGSALGELGWERIRPRGWDGKVKGRVESARIIMDRDSGRSKGFGFVTSAIDPRGNVATANYDSSGNLKEREGVSVKPIRLELKRGFAYNAHGQLTAITNAADANGDRSVDTFTYYTSGAQRGMVEVMMAIAVSGGLSLTTAYEYDDRGNVTRIVDPRGNDRLFTYNTLDQCVTRQTQQSSFGERVTTVFHYDANDNVVRCDVENRDETGALVAANPQWTTLFEHDGPDRLTGIVQEISEGSGLPGSYATNRFLYDGNDNLIEASSPLAVSGADPHNTVAFAYDERDLLFREIGAAGSSVQSTTQYDYDGNGNVIRVSEGLEGTPSITTVEYDGLAGTQGAMGAKAKAWMVNNFARFAAAGATCAWSDGTTVRVSKITDPLGNSTSFHYDGNSNLKVVRHFGETNDVPGSVGNRLLAETRYEYDSFDQLVRSRASFFDIFTEVSIGDGQSDTTFTYAPNGACTSVTDDNGHTTRFTYDGLGRLAAVTDPKTNVVQFAYDASGNLTNVLSSARSEVNQALQQFRRVQTYDALNRCLTSVDNVGNTNRYAYDSRDNVVSQFDPRENESFAVYDGLGRCVATTNYVGKERGITINTSHVEYDTNSRRTAATDSNGNTTTYAYDSLDRCVAVTEADGTSSSLVWSPRSNLLRHQDANGTVITNVYDLLDRCVSRVITPGPGVASTTTFETFAYDGASRCGAASNNVSLSTFAYNSLGNCVRQIQDGWQTTSTFDGVGNCLSQTYPGGRVITYTYDALDQPTTLSSSASGGLPATVLAQHAYDGPGRLGRLTRANNVNTRYQWNGLVSPPNGAEDFGWMQVRGINHQAAGNGPIVDQRVAAYDRSQNRTLRAQIAPFAPGGDTLTNTFDYDALDRLRLAIKTKGTSAQRVDYSLDGNGNRLSVAVDLVPEPYLMDNTFPDPADFQMNQYTLTPWGAFQYDAGGNRVARATATGALQYQYDYADRLVAVTDLSSGLPVLVSTYGYDALGRRLSKTVYSEGLPPVTTHFVYDGGCSIEERDNGTLKRTYAFPHVFDQKSRIMFTDLGETFYYHDDDLGNVLALTDAAGTVLERYEYDDFGAITFLTSDGLPTGATSSAVGNPYGWGGLRRDAETGLHNDGGGDYYDPLTGRDIGLPKITPKIAKESHGKFRLPLLSSNPWSHVSPIEMKKGTVKFFNEAKGFGFVADGGVNVKLIVPVAMDKGLRFGVRGGSTSGTRVQDHNSSRSNKSSSIVAGGGDPGDPVVKFVVKK